jgi:hypothetical protein
MVLLAFIQKLQGVGFDGVGWRFFGTEFVDFPAVEGLLRIQGMKGAVAAARRRSSSSSFSSTGC